MLDVIRSFFIAYWHVVLPLVVMLFLIIPIIVYWYEVRYWLMKAGMRVPMVGRISRWVKNQGEKEQATEANPNPVGFFSSERELCGFYETYIRDHQPSEDNFRRNQDYLGKINEDGRREKGIGLWLLVIVLMLVEASAFGFALAPYALTLATPNTALAGAFALGLVISIIGLFFSEFAGRALYKNSVVGHIMSFENSRTGGSSGDMMRTHIVTIDNTNIDDKLPQYQQMLNRVKVDKDGDKPAKRYTVLIGYGIFILGLAVAAFWVRTDTLNAQVSDLTANPPAISQPADDFPISAEDDIPMPSGMSTFSQESAGRSAQDQIDALHRASLVTFAVLSGLFIFIQVSSTYLAFIFGFAGTHSRKAWELTHKFSSADDFVRYHASKARGVMIDGQAALGTLQGRQLAVFRVNGDDREKLRRDLLNRTFDTYIAEQDTKKAFADQKAIIETLGKESRNVIESYIKKTIADLNVAINENDNTRINELISVAKPRIDKVNDPALASYIRTFQGIVEMFSAAPVMATPQLVQQAQTAVEPAPLLSQVAVPPAVQTFDHNAWGDLTGYEDDDMVYVANKKGIDVETIKRARRLQRLDKSEA